MKIFVTLFVASLTCFASFVIDAKEIKVIIATENPYKVTAVRQAFDQKFQNDQIEYITHKASSLIPEQPVGESIALKGCRNRLRYLPHDLVDNADYLVAIENYIQQSPQANSWSDIGLILIQDSFNHEKEVISHTRPTPIPSHYVEMAKKHSLNVSEEGFSMTAGKAIQDYFSGRFIDAQDWHREIEFGGVSRHELIQEAIFKALHADEINQIKQEIQYYPDFPKPGILFADFFPILSNRLTFKKSVDLLYEKYKDQKIDAIVGLESRGFLMGASLAYKLGVGFVPVRKPGKLPGATYSVSYQKEYGSDVLVISQSALKKDQRVLILDDLIATGGSAKAAIELVRLTGAIPVEFISLLEIRQLEGRAKLGIPSFNLIDVE